MTLGITPPLIDYIENGVTLIHPIPFEFQGLEEIVCQRINGSVITPCVEGADFTVTGGGGGTGTVTKTNGGVNGTVFRIKRVTTRGQPTDFVSHGNFPAQDASVALDRLAAVNQEQEIEVTDLEGRTVRVPLGETIAALPGPTDRKGTVFGFNILTGIRELLTYANLSTLLAPLLGPLLAAIQKGDPGGNIMAIGSFLAGPTINIPVGTDVVRTSCYSTPGKGGAFYDNDDATVDAAYVIANPRTAFVSANGRGFKLSLDQQLNVMMFGAIGDDTANDGAAFVAAIQFSYGNAQDGTGFGKAGPSVFAPLAKYYLGAQTLDFVHSIDFFGEGSVGTSGGAASQLRWDDVTAIRTQSNNTTGDTATGPQAYPGAAGSRIRNFYLKGAYAGVESEHHGILMRVKTQLDNIFIDNFAGDGLAVISGVGGNNNGWCVNRLFVRRCRDGLRVDGPNSQVGLATNIDSSDNRRWAGWESSQLGNTYQGVCENNGVTVGATPTLVSYNGHTYACVADQEAGAAVNAPSGDTTDNTWWYYCYDAGPDPARPAWFNGIVVRAGGAFRTSNVNGLNIFLNWYSENGQGPMQLTSRSLPLGGYRGAGIKGAGAPASIEPFDGGLLLQQVQVLKQLVLGDSASPVVADTNMFMDSVGGINSIIARRWVGGVPVVTNTFLSDANGWSCMGPFNIFSAPGPGLVASCDADGLQLTTGKGLYVGGIKVVGDQRGAIADAALAAAAPTQAEFNSLVIQFNTHLASDRYHGLIAT